MLATVKATVLFCIVVHKCLTTTKLMWPVVEKYSNERNKFNYNWELQVDKM